jgi:hypothetical protein
VGGFHSQSGWFGEEKSLTYAVNQNQNSTVVQDLILRKLAKPQSKSPQLVIVIINAPSTLLEIISVVLTRSDNVQYLFYFFAE